MGAARAFSIAALSGAIACAASSGLGAFQATRHADHPRVGTVASRSHGAVELAAVETRLLAARFVLLGEVHDHPDHHRIQARFVEQLASAGRPPAVVFEMLDPAKQEAIDAFLTEGGRDPDAFAARVRWSESGWPTFALYRPIFRAALEAGLPILAAGLPRSGSLAPDAPERSAGFGLDEPLPASEQAERLEEMFVGHCELMPRETLAPMVEIQRARDARLALALLRAEAVHGRAVLIAGNGHVRDGDVPALLVRAGVPRDAIVSVGLLEVDPEQTTVAETEANPFDFAVFTPVAERQDPCQGLRERFAEP